MRIKVKGISRSGQVETKIVDAPSVEELTKDLEGQGYILEYIKPIHAFTFIKRRLTHKDYIFMFSNMHNILKAGVDIVESLTLVAETSNKRLKGLLDEIKTDIMMGKSLSDSFRVRSEFPPIVSGIVSIGENTGDFVRSFKSLEQYFSKQALFKKRIKKATSYPLFILGGSSVMTMGLTIFVLPKMVEALSTLDVELNIVSRTLMAVSKFMQTYGLIGIPLVALLGFFIVKYIKKHYQYNIDKFKFNIPFINSMYRKIVTVEFAQSLAMLMNAGVNIIQSLDIVMNATRNEYVKEHIDVIKQTVLTGEALSKKMSPIIFDKVVINILAIGERSGESSEALLKSSDYLDEELDGTIEATLKVVNIALLVVISAVMGFVMYGIMGPMLDVTSQIG